MACLDVTGRACLVVGGGAVGLEKAAGLVACGAGVTVVSPELHEGFGGLEVTWEARRYESRDLDGKFLVIAATSDHAVNEAGPRGARARALLCYRARARAPSNLLPPGHSPGGPVPRAAGPRRAPPPPP